MSNSDQGNSVSDKSETPRADSVIDGIHAREQLRGFTTPEDFRGLCDVARQLEAELTAANKALALAWEEIARLEIDDRERAADMQKLFEDYESVAEEAEKLRKDATLENGFIATPIKEAIEVCCPSCKALIGYHPHGERGKTFFENELKIWALLDEVEGLRRGVPTSYAEGQDPVLFFTDEWTGLLPKKFIEESISRIDAAIQESYPSPEPAK